MNTIITGASKGIGRALVEKFASEGHNLAICARNEENLKSLKKELETKYSGIQVLIKSTDISKRKDVLAFAEAALKMFGSIDVLINNGGIFLSGSTCEENEGTLEKLIETNLYSAYHLTRAIVPFMTSSAKPHILNMCSIASQTAYPNGGSYRIY